jgi:type I restriction enzyme S subunit
MSSNGLTLADGCELIVDCPHSTAKESADAYAFAVGTRAISDGRINFAKARPVAEATYAKWTQRASPRAGDLILCREAPVGPVARVPESPRVCLGQRTVLLRPDRRKADSDYLMYVLLAAQTQTALRALAEGSTVPHLNVADVRQFPLALPSLEEQHQIAAVLGALDDKIDSNRSLASTLHELATTQFDRQFGDLAPARAGTNGWTEGTLGDLVDVNMGQSPPGSTYTSDPDEGILLVQGMGGMGVRVPTSDVFTTAPTKVTSAGSTLMTVRAPVGAVNVAHVELCLGRGVAGISSTRPAFTEYLMRALEHRWASEESGTIFPAVNRKQIVGLPLAIPREANIDTFETFARAIVWKLGALHGETQSLTALRNELLPKLVSGEVRVAAGEAGNAGRLAA